VRLGKLKNISGWLAFEIVELIRQPNPDQWICRLIKPISALDQPLAKSFGLPSDQVVVDVEQIEEIGDCEMSEINAMPRRSCVDLFTPAETAIYEAMVAVEKVGAHPLLTDAVVLLGQARGKVADYVELPADPSDTGDLND